MLPEYSFYNTLVRRSVSPVVHTVMCGTLHLEQTLVLLLAGCNDPSDAFSVLLLVSKEQVLPAVLGELNKLSSVLLAGMKETSQAQA